MMRGNERVVRHRLWTRVADSLREYGRHRKHMWDQTAVEVQVHETRLAAPILSELRDA